MKLIFGLGNPGGQYMNTRHNIGFMVVDKLAREISFSPTLWQNDKKHNCLTFRAGDLLLVKPQTYMNGSGQTVQSLLSFYKLNISDVWVIHDDIDLPLGKIKIRQQGSSGGHRGIESIIKSVGSDLFVRFRLGIGRGRDSISSETDKSFKRKTVISYVLSRFRRGEAGQLKHLVRNGTEAVRIALNEGIDKAMNRYN